MSASLFTQNRFRFYSAGSATQPPVPLVGGKVYFYAAGTTTPKDTYTDEGGLTANTNPVTLDARGEANIWLGLGAYKVVVTDADGVQQGATVDNIKSAAQLVGDAVVLMQAEVDGLASDIANSSLATKGAGQLGFDWSLAYAQSTGGWGVRSSANSHNVLRWITPDLWAAILNGTSTTDVSSMAQTGLDFIYANGGGELFIPGKLVCNTPLLVKDGVSIRGMGSAISRIVKDSVTTKAVTIVAPALAIYGGASLPANINAVLVLDGPAGRYRGKLSDFGVESTLATAGNYESQKAEFGIVSIGSVSDSTFEGLRILHCQYAFVMPVIFASEIRRCKYETCLRGFGVENGTSLNYASNYANNCRDLGHFIRDQKYSEISSNACDFLNDPAKYPTRSRLCNAYIIQSAIGCTVTGNGDENTWGRSYLLDAFDHSVLEGNVSIELGSDYTGAAEIAWIYSTDTMRGSRIRNNVAYEVKSGGLTYGGANAAKHHNIYFEGLTFVDQIEFNNNVARANRNGIIVEAGWGNNVPATWLNAARGAALVSSLSPTLQAQTMGNLSVAYGSDNAHYAQQIGSMLHIWGCFHVTPTYTTATGLLVINGFPTVGAKSAAVEVSGVGGGSALVSKLGWFEFSAGASGGVGRTDGDGNFTIADIPTGTTVRIFYDGWYSTV